jgi:hypothetical protein
VGPDLRWSVRRGHLGLQQSSRLFQSVPSAEVDDAPEGSWSRCDEELALLGGQALPCGGGGDVDRASHPLWRPSSVSVSLSCRVSGLGRFLLAWPLSLPWEELLPLWTRTRVRQTGAHDS